MPLVCVCVMAEVATQHQFRFIHTNAGLPSAALCAWPNAPGTKAA